MLKRSRPLLIVAGILLGSVVAAEPPNLGPHKSEIRAYVDSGDYARDIAAVAARAREWIEHRAKQGGAKLAVVFDLDETLLSNWPEMNAQDLGYVPETWNAWVDAGRAPAIDPMRDVYREARRLGIGVILLTGRRERDRASTVRNLRAIDCGEWSAMIFKPEDSKETIGAFKLAERKRLRAAGWTLIANLGDQASDFLGGVAERDFKLPDPFYITE